MTESLASRYLSHRWVKLAVIILVLLLATCLRLHELDTDSLWGDETFEVLHAQKDLFSILGTTPLAIRPTMSHTFMLIGDQDFLVRFSYAAVGILGVALMYKVGKALFDDITGIVGAFLLAISPFHIQYSQEARSYSWTILFVLTSLYCLYLALQDNQVRHWIGFSAATAFSLSNHVAAASVVASEVAYGALVLLLDRVSRTANLQHSSGERNPEPSRHEGRLGTWLRRLRASRGVMLAISALTGIAVFLLASGNWFSYLGQIGLSTAGPGTGNSDAVLRISDTFIKGLLSDFGAGSGPVLCLYGAFFLAGLGSCAIDRQWKQLLLAPIWILPPFVILPKLSASAYFSSRHLIYILPVYLLFAARGITGVGRLATRYLRMPANAKKLLQVACIVLVTGSLAWLSVAGIQAYYSRHKQDWRGAATLIRDEAELGDLVVQLMIWPTDSIPYYLDSLGAGETVKLVTTESVSENDFPATVWWVLLVSQPGGKPSPLPNPEQLAGSEFDTYSFYSLPAKSPALIRRKTPVADLADFWQLATKLLLIQAQSDELRRFGWYKDRLIQVSSSDELSPLPLTECPPELSDQNAYVDSAMNQIQDGQKQQALDSLLRAMALHEVLYPNLGKPHDSVLQAFHSLGDSALESGHRDCSVLFFSRAAQAHMLDVETDPGSIDHWEKLARALAKARRHEEAVVAYERLIELAPGRWEYYAGLAGSYRASGQHEKGIEKLEQAVELAPAEPKLRRRLADAYFLDGRMAEAAIAFHQILEASSGDIEARLGLALAYEVLGRKSEAIRELQTLIEIDPDHWLVPEAKERLEALE